MIPFLMLFVPIMATIIVLPAENNIICLISSTSTSLSFRPPKVSNVFSSNGRHQSYVGLKFSSSSGKPCSPWLLAKSLRVAFNKGFLESWSSGVVRHSFANQSLTCFGVKVSFSAIATRFEGVGKLKKKAKMQQRSNANWILQYHQSMETVIIIFFDYFLVKVNKHRKQNTKFFHPPRNQQNLVHFFALVYKTWLKHKLDDLNW